MMMSDESERYYERESDERESAAFTMTREDAVVYDYRAILMR